MKVRRYEEKDFQAIKAWGKSWGANYSFEQFPAVGFLVDDVAAYFLYQTDSSCCWLENMVSKRGTPKEIKEKALELIVDAILAEAKQLGFSVAYASTSIVKIAMRAKKHGAMVYPGHMFLTLQLT